jgi:hypothetical protein
MGRRLRGAEKNIFRNLKIPIDGIPSLLYIFPVLPAEGPLSRSGPSTDRAKAGRTGAPERSTARWLVERWEALRLALGAHGALPCEVGTLIPPPRGVDATPLAPPTAPSPRLGWRGTGKPRTPCAARMQQHARHSGASRSDRATRGPMRRTRNLDMIAHNISGFRVRA